MKKFLRIAIIAIVAILFIWTFFFLYQKSQPKTTVYDTVRVSRSDLEQVTVATGKIEPRDEIEIKPQISGIIAEIYKEAGQKVKAGEILAKVKVIPEMSSLNAAQSRVRLAAISLKQAKTDYDRMKNLFDQKLVRAEEFEKADVTLKQAE